ncbi:MAG: DoxX family membrane protein [Chloroflexi bacterium]|nr:DoxX family membrane protein [Chloroflexota bacterium]
MERAVQLFKTVDVKLTRWMARYSVVALRVGLGIVFLWFGALKFFPNLSPAEELAARTIETLTFGIAQPPLALPMLATLETLIGLGLIAGKLMRITLLLLLLQMIGTVTPLFLFPAETFTQFPYAPTLEGQYIIKNIVLVAGGLVIGATVRGGAVIADPEAAKVARSRESAAD